MLYDEHLLLVDDISLVSFLLLNSDQVGGGWSWSDPPEPEAATDEEEDDDVLLGIPSCRSNSATSSTLRIMWSKQMYLPHAVLLIASYTPTCASANLLTSIVASNPSLSISWPPANKLAKMLKCIQESRSRSVQELMPSRIKSQNVNWSWLNIVNCKKKFGNCEIIVTDRSHLIKLPLR